MRKLKAVLLILLGAVGVYMAPAIADITYTVGSGTTIFDFVCLTTKHCPAHVNINSAGTEIMTSGSPGFVQLNAGSAIAGKVGIDQTTDGTTNAVHLTAGSSIAGKVGVDQTTPGTTNGVALVGVNGATALAGNGTTGTGSPRVTIASDNSAIAGVGAGATGSAAPANGVYNATLQSGATGGQLKGLITCDNHFFKHITSSTDTLGVQGVASQTIYVCAWRARAAGSATWYLENTASANANCASTLTQLTGNASEVANSGETFGNAFWGGLKNTSGNGLCINSTGTGGVDVDVWYTQF